MCEKEIQLIAIMCLFDFVCGTQNLVSSFDFQEGHLDNPAQAAYVRVPWKCSFQLSMKILAG